MLVLQELVRLYAQYGKNRFDIFGDDKQAHQSVRMRKLYEGLLSGTITDDLSGARVLYGAALKVPASTFNSIKMRLQRRLVESVFFLDANRAFNNPRSKARQECIELIAAMRILQLHGANSAAFSIAERIYKTAERYSLTSAMRESCLTISHTYAYRGDQKSFSKFFSKASELARVQLAEDRSTLMLQKVSSWYAASWSLQQFRRAEIQEFVEELNVIRKSTGSATIHENYFVLAKILAEVNQEYRKIIELTNELRALYDENPSIRNGVVYWQFLISSMSANTWLGEYHKAFAIADELQATLPKTKLAWFTFQEQYWILAMRTGDYTLARSIFLEVVAHPKFQRNDAATLERWKLMEFYVRFVSDEPMRVSLLPEELLQSKSKYRHFRAFTSSFSTIVKDLQGFNVVAVFAQVLFLLRVKDFDSLIQRDESLQTLRRKRLSKLNYRLAIFAHLVHVMVEQNFEVAATKKAAAKWLTKLSNVPQKFKGGAAESLEIIPFEDLWQMMLKELGGSSDRR